MDGREGDFTLYMIYFALRVVVGPVLLPNLALEGQRLGRIRGRAIKEENGNMALEYLKLSNEHSKKSVPALFGLLLWGLAIIVVLGA